MRSAAFTEAVAFYVQAGSQVGLGHLARCAALSRRLKSLGIQSKVRLHVDALGKLAAAERGVIQDSCTTASGCTSVVIDAVEIPERDTAWIRGFEKRILISPVCDRADLATHVLVSSASTRLCESLRPGVKLIEDSMFSFVTAGEMGRRSCEFSEVVAGVCLSGGDDLFDLDDLIRGVLAVDRVSRIYLLDRRILRDQYLDGRRLCHCRHSLSPWVFFEKTNVFIGGEGLMIGEAVAQGLPAVSLCRDGHEFKNRMLIDAGCVKRVSRSPSGIAQLQSLLSSQRELEEMHRAALRVVSSLKGEALADRLTQIVLS